MRSLLEKAIVHLLNEEQDKAEALFHKFMVEKARRIHEHLRSGEAVLAEGWDDEITSEEYVGDEDLDQVEDHDDAAAGDTGGHAEAGDDLADDLGADADADMADGDAEHADADAEMADADAEDADMDGAGDASGDEPEAVEDRLADIEDQIEKLTADFDQMMSELDGEPGEDGLDDGATDDMDGDMADDGMGGDDAMGGHLGGDMGDETGDDMGGDDMAGMDDAGMDDDMAGRIEHDVTDDEHPEHEMAEDEDMMNDDEDHKPDDDGMMEGRKGKIPPQFMKNIKKKKVKEEKKVASKGEYADRHDAKKKKVADKGEYVEEEDESLDDITESVMAELERISVTMQDGHEVGDGKKITTNDKLPLDPKTRERGPEPVEIGKGPRHQGFERETEPTSKDYKARKNTVRGKADSVLSRVPDKGDKSALLNKDFAGTSKTP